MKTQYSMRQQPATQCWLLASMLLKHNQLWPLLYLPLVSMEMNSNLAMWIRNHNEKANQSQKMCSTKAGCVRLKGTQLWHITANSLLRANVNNNTFFWTQTKLLYGGRAKNFLWYIFTSFTGRLVCNRIWCTSLYLTSFSCHHVSHGAHSMSHHEFTSPYKQTYIFRDWFPQHQCVRYSFLYINWRVPVVEPTPATFQMRKQVCY